MNGQTGYRTADNDIKSHSKLNIELSDENYVDVAEKVILKIKREGKGKLRLTTSKIRNLLSMVSELQTDAKHIRGNKLSKDMQSRIQYLKMRIAYEAGRESIVRVFEETAQLFDNINKINDDKEKLILFCNYMEALVAYHRYYGGEDK